MKAPRNKIKKTIYPTEDSDMYTCVYVIDIPAKSFLEAAKGAQNIMRNPEFGECFHVMHINKGIAEVDLHDNHVEDVTNKPEVD